MTWERTVWIVGHKNPDTDSVCAAIAYADLKNKTEEGVFEAKRCGHMNEETKYVLEHFGVNAPSYISDVGAQIKDIELAITPGVDNHISMKNAWELMKQEKAVTLPVVREDGTLEGLIVNSDIAGSYMDVYDNHILGRARTQYKNMVETLEGQILCGNAHAYYTKGKVVVATATPEMMEEYIQEDDLVIVGNRYEVQLCAIEMNASCIIVCSDAPVSKTIVRLAQEKDCVLMTTPYDTYTVARLINQSIPIKYFMRKDRLITFHSDDYVEDVKEIMGRERHRDFPVLDEEGRYVGMLSRRRLLNMRRKQVILVDHNEKNQAVDGIEEAELLEIIDHHRLGSLETISPVYFRNQHLVCTSTIIYQMYLEKGVPVPEKIAGILCAAILSDTLMFRSPTCTALDKAAAEELARLAHVDIPVLAEHMFQAGSDFSSKSPDELLFQDFKTFLVSGKEFVVAQITSKTAEDIEELI